MSLFGEKAYNDMFERLIENGLKPVVMTEEFELCLGGLNFVRIEFQSEDPQLIVGASVNKTVFDKLGFSLIKSGHGSPDSAAFKCGDRCVACNTYSEANTEPIVFTLILDKRSCEDGVHMAMVNNIVNLTR